MFPTALRLRSESALETRAVMIAEELFSSVRLATNINNVILRAGPKLDDPRNYQAVNLTNNRSVVIGYPSSTSVPFYLWYSGRGGDADDPDAAWNTGRMPSDAAANSIQTLAKLWATNITNNLYQVTVEVRAPAVAPSARPIVFTTYHYAP